MKKQVNVTRLVTSQCIIVSKLLAMAEDRQVEVSIANLPEGVHSLYIGGSEVGDILINETININQIRYELARSLRHATLHKGINIDCYDEDDSKSPLWKQMKREADRFGRKLILKLTERYIQEAS